MVVEYYGLKKSVTGFGPVYGGDDWAGRPIEHPQQFGEVVVGGHATLGAVKQSRVCTDAEFALDAVFTPRSRADGYSVLGGPALWRVVYQNGTSTKPFVVLASPWFDEWYPNDGTGGLVP